MDNLIFWQTVGAVALGNALFALTGYMVWRVSREEKGLMPKAGPWMFVAGLVAPAIVIFALLQLP